MNKVVINVHDILDEVGAEERLTFEQDFSPIKIEANEIQFVLPVTFAIKLENTGSGIRVKGHITSSVKLTCGRCLTEFDFPIDWAIDEIFYTPPAPEEEAYTLKGETIDLGPPTEEEFVLAIPMKPLCSESCQGICPICGQVITTEHEDHGEVKIDARLAVLKKLLDEEKE